MLVLTNGKIITMETSMEDSSQYSIFDPGWIAIEGSTISGVGQGTDPPPGCSEVIDLQGRVVSPGLVDAHTHLGLFEESESKEGDDMNEMSAPITSHLRAIDGINPRDTGFAAARESGVTCACCLPGSTNVVGGSGVVAKTAGNVVDKMVLKQNAGLKTALGENPKRTYGERKQMPTTRMGNAALLREKLTEALGHKDKNQSQGNRGIMIENFEQVLSRQIPLRIHAHRADDIITGIRIGDEFNLSVILEHCTEAYHVVEEIAERDIPVVYGPVILSKVKQELEGIMESTPSVLAQSGVDFALTTDHPEVSIKYLTLSAIICIRGGLSAKEALRAVTISPANILGVSDRVGSLACGKDADIVVWDRHPLDIFSRVEYVWINGEPVVDNGSL